MIERVVQLFLKTPLFRFWYEVEGRRRLFPAGIVFVEGRVLKEKGGGLWLQVSAIGDGEKEPTLDVCGLHECIIPMAKVDFVRFLPTPVATPEVIAQPESTPPTPESAA